MSIKDQDYRIATDKEINTALYGGRRSKYGVDYSAAGKEKRTYNGIVFDSVYEKDVWIKLEMMQTSGLISDLKRQVKFPLHAWDEEHRASVRVSTYEADFVYEQNGEMVVADAKGVLTALYRLKRAWLKAQYGIIIEEL